MRIIASFRKNIAAPDGQSVTEIVARTFSDGDCLADVFRWYDERRHGGGYTVSGSVDLTLDEAQPNEAY